MITFEGYENTIKEVYNFQQEHIFKYWQKLNNEEKISLLNEVSKINFEQINNLYAGINNQHTPNTVHNPAQTVQADPSSSEYKKIYKSGEDYIRNGNVAAFVVAGGQGSRLDFDGPKGAFLASPCKKKSLFQIFAEKIKKASIKYNTNIPFFIMTSEANHEDTLIFFEKNNYFDLNKSDVYFFTQSMLPSLDINGKLVLNSPCSLFKNPDGHGGSLTALYDSGMLKIMEERCIETVSYFQIDNPLVKIIDPAFIGYHKKNNAQISSKAVIKEYPEEKIGLFVEYDNKKNGIVEYSDMPEKKINAKDESGKLKYRDGNIAIHLFDLNFIKEITSEANELLPYHVAKKKIKAFQDGSLNEIEGFKFEKFVFDSLPLAEKSIILEVVRNEEFAPIKNKEGNDSINSSQKLMSSLFKKWLNMNNITVPEKVKKLEISPLLADCAEDLSNLKDKIIIPNEEKVYLE